MSRKAKYTTEQKVKACEEYLSAKKSAIQIAKEFNMGKYGDNIIRTWVRKYEASGVEAFIPSNMNSAYTKELKLMVVQEYLNNENSLGYLANKYKINSIETVRKWILKYNRLEELEDYLPNPEVYKMSSRKTSLEERIEIVNWCKEHNNNYKEAASLFKCSYTQVYSWVKKYNDDGEEGLDDRRGCRKSEANLTTEEKLKRENGILARKNEELERQIELLKKLNAFEWKE